MGLQRVDREREEVVAGFCAACTDYSVLTGRLGRQESSAAQWALRERPSRGTPRVPRPRHRLRQTGCPSPLVRATSTFADSHNHSIRKVDVVRARQGPVHRLRCGTARGCPNCRRGGTMVLQDGEVRFVAVPGFRTPIAAHVASETAYHGDLWPVRGLVTVAVLAYCRQVYRK